MGVGSSRPISHSEHYRSKKLPKRQKTGENIEQENEVHRETLLACFPKDFYTLLFGLLMLVGTAVSVIDFFRTGNTSMLTTLCYMAAGHTGLQKVNNLLKGQLAKQSHDG